MIILNKKMYCTAYNDYYSCNIENYGKAVIYRKVWFSNCGIQWNIVCKEKSRTEQDKNIFFNILAFFNITHINSKKQREGNKQSGKNNSIAAKNKQI